jgi:hypothetical protein
MSIQILLLDEYDWADDDYNDFDDLEFHKDKDFIFIGCGDGNGMGHGEGNGSGFMDEMPGNKSCGCGIGTGWGNGIGRGDGCRAAW